MKKEMQIQLQQFPVKEISDFFRNVTGGVKFTFYFKLVTNDGKRVALVKSGESLETRKLFAPPFIGRRAK